jgi:hypothetical protein
VSTSTQWLGTSVHSGGASLFCRVRIARPGASSSQVMSAVIAPHGMMVTLRSLPMVTLH